MSTEYLGRETRKTRVMLSERSGETRVVESFRNDAGLTRSGYL